MKLIARNLPRQLKQHELRALFQPFGEVKFCNLVLDQKTNQSKGFGFVEMSSFAEAKEAIRRLNNQLVMGERIRVKKADKPANPPATGPIDAIEPQAE